MTPQEFNKKWSLYLKERYYGLDINNEEVALYLDKEFEKEIISNPDFRYYQIKTKFNSVRVYADSSKCSEWEDEISKILEKC